MYLKQRGKIFRKIQDGCERQNLIHWLVDTFAKNHRRIVHNIPISNKSRVQDTFLIYFFNLV